MWLTISIEYPQYCQVPRQQHGWKLQEVGITMEVSAINSSRFTVQKRHFPPGNHHASARMIIKVSGQLWPGNRTFLKCLAWWLPGG